ncbi:RNA polymerase sigma factor [Actinomadura gamaensis]|uniref:RNA polymerase sigma factor n=1 Tax=Actinomadura gamaensis TaxID=1763541 RepID=A0ABV9TU69_9ACTN
MAPTSDRSSDNALELARAGDEASFLLLVDTFGGRLSRLAREIVDSAPGRAETLAREALLGVVRDAPPPGRPSARLWLLRLVIEAARTRWPLEVAVRPEDAAATEDVPPVPLDGPAQDVLRDALSALPLRHRLPVLLSDGEGCTEAEAAWLLDITPEEQRVLLRWGRASLHHALRARYGSVPPPGGPLGQLRADGISERSRNRLLLAFRGSIRVPSRSAAPAPHRAPLTSVPRLPSR